MVQHNGTTVAFAMDDQRRIYYTVLDLEQASAKRGPLDAKYWNEEPALVPFPGELVEVAGPGAAATGLSLTALRMPVVRKGSRTAVVGTPVPEDERDGFLSTTARLSAAQQFQVVSDGRYLILFRESVEAAHRDMVLHTPTGSTAPATAVVDRSLLCDRFVLAGSALQPVVEVRFQRSRSKRQGASDSDSLGTRDMEGNPFHEPTSKLSFVGQVRDGQFAALLIPTAVAGKFRWELFATNAAGAVEGYNCAQREDGAFDVAGTELYTSPDPKFAPSVLERAPGTCPFTRRPLVLVPAVSDRAGTALRFDPAKSTHVRVPALPGAESATPKGYTVEAWVKARATPGTIVSHHPASSPTSTFALELDRDLKPVADFGGTRVVSAQPVLLDTYTHIAAVYDGGKAVLYVNGDTVGSVAATAVPNAGAAAVIGARLGADAPQYSLDGDVDEVRIWERARQTNEFADRGRRLTGIEPGLSGYYRFDEGTGTVVGDHTRARRHAEARNTPEWVGSGAPVGDGTGLARDVFGIVGRTVSTGLAATLYTQQEPAVSGYGGTTVVQEKRQTRLLLVCGTTGPAPAGGDANRSYVTAVDFGVTRDGRLAWAPTSVTLPERGKTALFGDAAITVADAQAAVDAARAALAADRVLAAQIPQILAECAANNVNVWWLELNRRWDLGSPRFMLEAGLALRLRAAQAAQQRLGSRQAELDAAENQLVMVSGGTLGGGDVVVEMPLVSTDRDGLTVFGALLAFAWTDKAPFLLDSSTGDVVLYFRGGTGQFFSAYYSALVSRATRSTKVGNGSVQFVARDTSTRMKDFTVQVAADAAADLCTVTVTRGTRTETFRGVPRAAASLTAVLNGNPPVGTVLGSVRSVKDRLVELATPLAEPLAVGSRVSVGGRIRRLDATAPVGATTFTVTGDAVTAGAGTQVTAVLYDYADATCNVPGVDLSCGSQIVGAVPRDATGAVPDGIATDAGDGVGPHWRGHAPGRAPTFDGTQTLRGSAAANFDTDADVTVEAWVKPGVAPGRKIGDPGTKQYRVAQVSATGSPRVLMELITGHLHQSLTLEPDNWLDCGDRLDLNGRDFTVEMRVCLTNGNHRNLVTYGQGSDTAFSIDILQGALSITVSGPTPLNLVTTNTGTFGSWEQWSVVFSSGRFQVYRDGAAVGLINASGNNPNPGGAHRYTETVVFTGGPLRTRIGAEPQALSSPVGIDEVRVWGTTRSETQIRAGLQRRLRGGEADLLAYWQFEDKLTVDRSGNGHDATLTGPFRSTRSPLLGYRPAVTVGEQGFSLNTAKIPFGDWSHIAFAHKQKWAMATDGGHLDAGGPGGLDLTGDLTIEASVYLDRLGVVHGLVGKGALGGGRAGTAVPYSMWVEADGHLGFAFESGDGRGGVTSYRSQKPLQVKSVARLAITRKSDGRGKHAITMYIAGTYVSTSTYEFEGAPPIGNEEDCELGRTRWGNDANRLRGCLMDVRIWNIARDAKQIGLPVKPDTPGLVAWWNFPEKDGPITEDACGAFPAKLRGARRIRTPDLDGNQGTFYVNGVPATAQISQGAPAPTPPAGQTEVDLGAPFVGALDELRVWRTCRSREQILDNMFGRLRGEQNDLVVYYPFDGASTTPGAKVKDAGPRGVDLTPSSPAPQNVVSTAPISTDAPEVRSALTGISSTFNSGVDTTPAASEYGDLQVDANGRPAGVMKRVYAYIRHNRWHLRTGYKIGNLTTTWVGQAQFDPQLIGFLEGAPPVPSENLVWGTGEYSGTASVAFVQADSITNTISHDRKDSSDASAKMSLEGSLTYVTNIVTAPLGVGEAKPLQVKGVAKYETEVKNSHGWSNNVQVSQGTGTTRTSKVSLTGQWEEAAASGQVNPAAGRRWVPANTGFAVVQSATADLYALRVAHTGALVAYRMVPNADIPRDWNILAFPINPRYTKQGSLDGLVGYAPKGTSGALQPFPDPAFPNAGDNGEYSYYRPREAYALKRRIQREEQQLQSFYESLSTSHTTLASRKSRNPVRDQADRVLRGMLGGVKPPQEEDSSDPAATRKAAQDASRRHMANTFVWTAAGGLFSETTTTTNQVSEVVSGQYSLVTNDSLTVGVEVKAVAWEIKLNLSMSFGSAYAITRSKTKQATRTFSLDVVADPGRNLQKYEDGKPVFDIDRKPVLAPGRVDAYRFMTFYLDSSSDNYEDFYGKVIDPEWLDRDTGAAARALRQTRQGDRKPPCWRVLHRVTYVSRVQDTGTAAPSLARAMGALGIPSDYQLLKQLEPHLARSTGSPAALATATKDTIAARFPTLVPYTDAITARVTAYYNPGAPALPAAPAPATTPVLMAANPTVARGGEITFAYSTPSATVAPKNWVGLYRAGTSPGNGEALVWRYAPAATGTVALPTTGCAPGTYTAWYLHNDGYTPLGGPTTVTIT